MKCPSVEHAGSSVKASLKKQHAPVPIFGKGDTFWAIIKYNHTSVILTPCLDFGL